MEGSDQDQGWQPPPLVPECDFLLVMEHESRVASTRCATDAFWEYRHLIIASLQYIEDEHFRDEVQKALLDPRNILTTDIIRNFKAEIATGTPYSVIWEVLYSRLEPMMELLWGKVKRYLVQQQLLPWTIGDPQGQIQSMLLDQLSSKLSAKLASALPQTRFEDSPRAFMRPRELDMSNQAGIGMEYTHTKTDDSLDASIPHRDGDEVVTVDSRFVVDVTKPEMIKEPRVRESQTTMSEPTASEEFARSMAHRRPKHRLVERIKPYPDKLGLPSDYIIPEGVDENPFKDLEDDVPEDYRATDEELDEASRVYKRALRKKSAMQR